MSRYAKGYKVEHFCREKLREMGAIVVRSAASKGPADLVAIFPEKGEIWLIQVKKADAPKNLDTLKRRFKDLSSLAGEYLCRSFVYMKMKGRYRFIEIGEKRKTYK